MSISNYVMEELDFDDEITLSYDDMPYDLEGIDLELDDMLHSTEWYEADEDAEGLPAFLRTQAY